MRNNCSHSRLLALSSCDNGGHDVVGHSHSSSSLLANRYSFSHSDNLHRWTVSDVHVDGLATLGGHNGHASSNGGWAASLLVTRGDSHNRSGRCRLSLSHNSLRYHRSWHNVICWNGRRNDSGEWTVSRIHGSGLSDSSGHNSNTS